MRWIWVMASGLAAFLLTGSFRILEGQGWPIEVLAAACGISWGFYVMTAWIWAEERKEADS